MPTSIGQDVLLVQEELVAVAVLQLWLHNEVDELSVIRGGGVGHVGIVQLPIWGGSDRGEKGSLSGGALHTGEPLAQGRLVLRGGTVFSTPFSPFISSSP